MLPEIVRFYIGEFGRSTLVRMSEMRDERYSLSVICEELGLTGDMVEDCVQCGAILRRIADEQRRFEDALGDS